MGGGGRLAARAAARVAGIGVVHSGTRGGISSVTPPAEHSVRNASRCVPAVISQIGKADVSTAVQSPSWEFAGGKEELLPDVGKPMPRVVFGGAPSLQEAKDATNELDDALDEVYLSSPTHKRTDGSFELSQVSSLSLLNNSDHLETNNCTSAEPTAASVQYAMNAFALLNESPAAQTLASIASDPNVWDAVWENDVFTEYLQTYKTNVDLEDQKSQSKVTEVSDNESHVETGKSKNGLGDFFENIKQRVVETVSNVTTFQNIFGASSAENTSAASDARFGFMDKTLGASFMSLAMMVILVVMLKRV